MLLEILEFIAIGSALGGGIIGTFVWKKRHKKEDKKGLDLVHKKIELLSDVLELKIKKISDINLLDIFLMNKLLLQELYKEIVILKGYDIHVNELMRLESIIVRLEELIRLEEESKEVEEIIMGILLKSVKLVKMIVKTKDDELAYEQYENELLKKDVAEDLLEEYEKEHLRNEYTNEFLEMKKEWVKKVIEPTKGSETE